MTIRGPVRPLTYLITGGSGSFGVACIRTLLEAESDCRILSFSRNATLRYQLRQAIPDPRLSVLAGDVTDLEDLFRIQEPIDVVIHAAAEKHIDTGEDYPRWVEKINVGGAHNVILFAVAREIPSGNSLRRMRHLH